MLNTIKPVKILLVEDNESDIKLIEEAFSEASLYSKLSVVRDGEEAGMFLSRKGEFDRADKPELILLDLNMPKKNGIELLNEIKCDDELKKIPVIVLTTSSSTSDIKKCYDLQANSYIVKPLKYSGYISMVEKIEKFWMKIVRLPQ